MSLLAKIGVFFVAILLVVSLLAPLLAPFFEEQVIPRLGGNPPEEAVAINGDEAWKPEITEPRYDIMTVLGYDAIPAILAPEFASVTEAEEWIGTKRAGHRTVHKRRSPRVLHSSSQSSRDRQRHSWRQACRRDMVTALLLGHSLWPPDRRHRAHLRRIRQAHHERPRDV